MKILHLVTTSSGGAYQAAKRLDSLLNSNGYNSKILVFKNTTNDTNVHEINNGGFIQKNLIRIKIKLSYILGKMLFFSTQYDFSNDLYGVNLTKNPLIKEADIIHVHWISNFITIKELYKLHKMGKKIYWTLHDMWAFTGGCFYDKHCTGYTKDCVNCVAVKKTIAQKAVEAAFRYRKKYLNAAKVTFIGCSKWITNCAKQSGFIENDQVVNIPNTIDTQLFCPLDRIKIRNKLGFDSEKKYILVGAASPTDERKGYQYIEQLVKKLDPKKYVLVLFGKLNKELKGYMNIIDLGVIKEQSELVEIYNSADVFLAPSIQENLANTVMESLSCGTPVVAFNIGGMPDMIVHKENGYLASSLNLEELEKGIEYCCFENVESLREGARKYMIDNFKGNIIIEDYKKIYK